MTEPSSAQLLNSDEDSTEGRTPEVVRKPELDALRCAGCGVCVVACPHTAVELKSLRSSGRIIVAPEISDNCVACGVCVTVCPFDALTPPA